MPGVRYAADADSPGTLGDVSGISLGVREPPRPNTSVSLAAALVFAGVAFGEYRGDDDGDDNDDGGGDDDGGGGGDDDDDDDDSDAVDCPLRIARARCIQMAGRFFFPTFSNNRRSSSPPLTGPLQCRPTSADLRSAKMSTISFNT